MADNLQWEYLVQVFGSTFSQPKEEELNAILNEWGSQGWEVFSLSIVESTNKIRVAAKRPLSEATRRRRTMPL